MKRGRFLGPLETRRFRAFPLPLFDLLLPLPLPLEPPLGDAGDGGRLFCMDSRSEFTNAGSESSDGCDVADSVAFAPELDPAERFPKE